MEPIKLKSLSTLLFWINILILAIESILLINKLLVNYTTSIEYLKDIDCKTLSLLLISHCLLTISLHKNIKMGEYKLNIDISPKSILCIFFIVFLFGLYSYIDAQETLITQDNQNTYTNKTNLSILLKTISIIFLNISIFFFGNLFNLIGKERKNKQETKSKVINKKRKTETNETIEITYK